MSFVQKNPLYVPSVNFKIYLLNFRYSKKYTLNPGKRQSLLYLNINGYKGYIDVKSLNDVLYEVYLRPEF